MGVQSRRPQPGHDKHTKEARSKDESTGTRKGSVTTHTGTCPHIPAAVYTVQCDAGGELDDGRHIRVPLTRNDTQEPQPGLRGAALRTHTYTRAEDSNTCVQYNTVEKAECRLTLLAYKRIRILGKHSQHPGPTGSLCAQVCCVGTGQTTQRDGGGITHRRLDNRSIPVCKKEIISAGKACGHNVRAGRGQMNKCEQHETVGGDAATHPEKYQLL